MPALPLLTLDSIAASTPDKRVLFDGLTLSIGADRIGLVGCNGCGKSTLLKILAGSVEPSTAQHQREDKDRRDSAGRAFARRGSEPKIFLGRQAERAETTGGRSNRLSEKQVAEASHRFDLARAKVEIVTPLRMTLPASKFTAGFDVLSLDRVTVAYGDHVLGPWTPHAASSDRVAVVGPNGTGKTTLLKAAAGRLAPSGGSVRHDGRVAMLDQHVTLLDSEATVLANVRRHNPDLDDEAAHAACARFAFRNRAALRRVAELSGANDFAPVSPARSAAKVRRAY